VKFEIYTNETITTAYPRALVPIFVIELKTNEKIINGNENMSSSFMDKLTAYREDLTTSGIR
jgi:hypothetical protein